VIKKVLLHPLVVWGCRLIVAAVLIYAAVQKIWMPLEFARLIREYHLLPDQVLNLVAVILPWFEIVCGLSFLSGLWLMGTALLFTGLNSITIDIGHESSNNKIHTVTMVSPFFGMPAMNRSCIRFTVFNIQFTTSIPRGMGPP